MLGLGKAQRHKAAQPNNPVEMQKHKFSFFDNESECISALLEIHNKGRPIDCDPMYNQGMFYNKPGSNVAKPRLRFDINSYADCACADATKLPLASKSIDSIILDPPFMFGTHGKTYNNRIQKRYSMFSSLAELELCYRGILREAYRVLRRGGVLIFKCQDYTDSRTTMTHCLIWQWAQQIGFYAKDLAILNLPKSKIYNPRLQQRHLRKTHCYFWVFCKA